MNFSAKKLLTMSAAQLIYLNQHPELCSNRITEQILEGQRFQQNVLAKLKESTLYYDEMGGCYSDNAGNNIYFSHDIVKANGTEIIETKYANGNSISENYICKSILQCAVYDTLTRFSPPWLYKSKFARTPNNISEVVCLDDFHNYYLLIGNRFFRVKLRNPYPILNFIKEKARIVAQGDYNNARCFDSKWKGNEYSILKNCFEVTEMMHPYLL